MLPNLKSLLSRQQIPVSREKGEILVVSELAPRAASAFNEGVRIDFHGTAFDEKAAVAAIRQIVERHDSLRFALLDMERGWSVAREFNVLPIRVSGENGEDPESWIRDRMRRPFQTDSCLWEAALFRGRQGKGGTLVFVAHHSICDGRSFATIIDEFAALYDGATDLAGIPGQYADFLKDQPAWAEHGAELEEGGSSAPGIPPDFAVDDCDCHASDQAMARIEKPMRDGILQIARSNGDVSRAGTVDLARGNVGGPCLR